MPDATLRKGVCLRLAAAPSWAPITTIYLVSLVFLLTSPGMLELRPWGFIWRVAMIPAYVLWWLASAALPWSSALLRIGVSLMVTFGLDTFLWRERNRA